jgi:hypothetical protein
MSDNDTTPTALGVASGRRPWHSGRKKGDGCDLAPLHGPIGMSFTDVGQRDVSHTADASVVARNPNTETEMTTDQTHNNVQDDIRQVDKPRQQYSARVLNMENMLATYEQHRPKEQTRRENNGSYIEILERRLDEMEAQSERDRRRKERDRSTIEDLRDRLDDARDSIRQLRKKLRDSEDEVRYLQQCKQDYKDELRRLRDDARETAEGASFLMRVVQPVELRAFCDELLRRFGYIPGDRDTRASVRVASEALARLTPFSSRDLERLLS